MFPARWQLGRGDALIRFFEATCQGFGRIVQLLYTLEHIGHTIRDLSGAGMTRTRQTTHDIGGSPPTDTIPSRIRFAVCLAVVAIAVAAAVVVVVVAVVVVVVVGPVGLVGLVGLVGRWDD